MRFGRQQPGQAVGSWVGACIRRPTNSFYMGVHQQGKPSRETEGLSKEKPVRRNYIPDEISV